MSLLNILYYLDGILPAAVTIKFGVPTSNGSKKLLSPSSTASPISKVFECKYRLSYNIKCFTIIAKKATL